MRNVKIYNCFLNNINYSFKIKLFKISLSRTFIFNFDNNRDIYYRKTNMSRKISLIGKEKAFLLCKRINFDVLDLSRFNMKKINNILSEYISYSCFSDFVEDGDFDIIEKKKRKVVTSDSFIRKFYRDEIVTMCFDDDNVSNMIWINELKNKDQYNNINI